jgi:probable HAF family extracellular repeat protein
MALGALAASQAAFAQCASYSVDILKGPQGCQILPSAAGARGINDAGDLCGGYNVCAEAGHSVIWWANGTVTELPLSSDQGFPLPFDLNSAGQVCGRLEVPGLTIPRAFRFSDGVTLNLDTLPGGNWSEATAISENGTVCGYSTGIGQPLTAFIWHNGRMSALNLPVGPESVAYGVADNGAICGWMGEVASSHAFIWLDGQTTDLDTVLVDSDLAQARGISSNGRNVCGLAGFFKLAPTRFAFFWSNGRAQNLGILPVPGHDRSIAYAVNNSGVVVGHSSDSNLAGMAFVWRNGVMQALQDLIPPELNLDNLFVWSINNAGQIAGQATRPSSIGFDETVAVRLTPIIPPAGDCDCNGVVNIDDLLRAINQWGPAIPTTSADFNNDGLVNVADILTVIEEWD